MRSGANQDIREVSKEAGVKLWQIAERLGMTEWSFSRKMRRELLPEEKMRIMEAVSKIREEMGGGE